MDKFCKERYRDLMRFKGEDMADRNGQELIATDKIM
jgi:hypothetical protein